MTISFFFSIFTSLNLYSPIYMQEACQWILKEERADLSASQKIYLPI